jgi:hypothetical protein
MATKKIGRGFIIAGMAGIGLLLLLTILHNRWEGILSIQILGVEISAIIILLGIWMARTESIQEFKTQKQIAGLVSRVLNLPSITWVMTGFLLIYLLQFLAPVFLSPTLQMNFFSGYLPNMNPIGNDLREMMGLIKGWAVENQSPYLAERFYPPLTYIIFTPLLLVKDYLTLYQLFTLITFFSYCFLTLLLPLKIIEKRHFVLALLLFVTGLFSYGFQFEVERGQYNVLTFLLCLFSVYIFHYHPRYRLIAYVLFSISIQLKLYPAIFIVMFVDDWRDWKKTLLRFAGIGLFNFLLLFVMGYQSFWEFIHSVTTQISTPSWWGPWNHSISAFISTIKQDGFGLVDRPTLRMLRPYSNLVETLLLLTYLVLFGCALTIFHLRKEKGLDTFLLLTCTIGALTVPISYDYTLSILTAPMILFLCGIPEMNTIWKKGISILLILGISAAYFSMLIPYDFRPYVLQNAFPLLFIILVLTTILNFIRYENAAVQPLKN